MGKYIIELERGETAYKTVNSNGKPMIQLLAPTPYTEPDLEQVRKEAYEDGYKTAKVQCNIQAEKDLREVGERHYQKGLSDAWEAARKISMSKINGGLSWEVMNDIFDTASPSKIYKTFTASEAIEKIRQYEQPVTTEDVMRQYLDTFCKNRSCSGCPLNTPDFTCGRGYHFLTAEPVSDEEVRRAYAKVLQKVK